MKKISFVEFESLFVPIIKFLEDCHNNDEALKTLYPSSYVTAEHGNELLDYYIDLAERFLELENDWISWFVFDNDLGNSCLSAFNNEKEYQIDSIEALYNFLNNY